jgi:glycosyltransferase involved in cell wall biosynthesis
VLYVIDGLFHAAGAENSLQRMVQLLPKDRFDCAIATFRAGNDHAWFKQFGCPIHMFPLRRTWDWQGLQTAHRFHRFLRTHQFDIVHTFFETSDIWGGAIARWSGVPVLVSSRRDMGIQRSFLHTCAYRLCRRMFSQVQTVSEAVRRASIDKDGYRPERVVTIANGIDTERVAAAQRAPVDKVQFGVVDNAPLIATVGHVRQVKGIDVLVRAAALVRREIPSAMFVVAGSPWHNYFPQIEQLTRSLGLQDNIRFLGRIDDTFPLLRAADIFCLLSRSEGMSNAVLEAMAFGLPCVATHVGGNPELIEDGQTGFLVNTEDPDTAAARMLDLLRNPARARQMGRAGRVKIYSSFTAQMMIDRIVRQYDALLKTKAGAARSLDASQATL